MYNTNLKLKIKNINDTNQITIVGKILSNEYVNMKEIELFNSRNIKGFMKPLSLSKKKIIYISPIGESLSKILQKGVSKELFFLLIAQVADIVKKTSNYGFDLNNLVLDLDYMFYNTATKEVNMLYRPVLNNKSVSNVQSFVYYIINFTFIESADDRFAIDEFYKYLTNIRNFSMDDIERYIEIKYPNVYRKYNRYQKGRSRVLNQKDIFDISYNSSGPFVSEQNENLNIGNDISADSNSEFDDENTTLLMDDEATTLLDDSEGTTLLYDEEPNYPYLIRINTYDRTDVNKPVFRIGKEKSYVDYFVSNNSAVSRLHADIITRNGRYYIKDNNSTNHTFVNGTVIQTGIEIEIKDGDAIMLANEPFEFHID